jgi:hypothetical protein
VRTITAATTAAIMMRLLNETGKGGAVDDGGEAAETLRA